jgi:hypothetical protein
MRMFSREAKAVAHWRRAYIFAGPAFWAAPRLPATKLTIRSVLNGSFAGSDLELSQDIAVGHLAFYSRSTVRLSNFECRYYSDIFQICKPTLSPYCSKLF